MYSADLEKSINCLQWVQKCGGKGLDSVVFRKEPNSGLGCFACKRFEIGDLLFSIPQACLFGFQTTQESAFTSSLDSSDLKDSITAEFLIWIHMAMHRDDPQSKYHTYFKSLGADCPSIDLWPSELRDALEGTDLAAALKTTSESFNRQVEAFEKSSLYLPAINRSALLWAKSHYLSRRYPGKFAAASSASASISAGGQKGNTVSATTANIDSSTYEAQQQEIVQSLGLLREKGMENLGVLVPVLDILNHDASRDWLQLRVNPADSSLHVLCNYPRNKVCIAIFVIIYFAAVIVIFWYLPRALCKIYAISCFVLFC
jgi:hypothetical protein